MTRIIQYRTYVTRVERFSLAVRAARGNLGTIALVNGQFLFWLVSKGTGKPTSTKGKRIWLQYPPRFRYFIIDLWSFLLEYARKIAVRIVVELLICCDFLFLHISPLIYPLGIFSLLMQSAIRLASFHHSLVTVLKRPG